MNEIVGLPLFFGGLLIVLGSIALGYWVINRAFSKGVFGIDNAPDLLRMEKTEEWNALRQLNPHWKPDLKGKDFSSLQLRGIDFHDAQLDGANFVKSVLDEADFTSASLVGANFSQASLRQASLDNTSLEGAQFEEALVEETTFKNARGIKDDLRSKNEGVLRKPVKTGQELVASIRKNPELLREISGKDFEVLVAETLKGLGYDVMITSGVRDKGVDIIATQDEPLGKITSVIECKHYAQDKSISLSAVHALYAMKEFNNADRAVLVTSNRLSPQAREFASQRIDITLVDREKLIEWINISKS